MANRTKDRGRGERPTDAQVAAIQSKIEDMVIRKGLDVTAIAQELGLPHSTAYRYYRKVKEKYSGLLTEQDRREFIERSITQHEQLLKEGLLLIDDAKTVPEPDKRAAAIAKGIDCVTRAQAGYEQFADKFLSFAGDSLKGAQITFNVQNVVSSPQWDEFMNYLIQWLESKGLDPAQLAEFIEDVQAGLIKPKKMVRMGKLRSRELERGGVQFDNSDEASYLEEAKALLQEDAVDIEVKEVEDDPEAEVGDSPT